jgi:hypothetical protein
MKNQIYLFLTILSVAIPSSVKSMEQLSFTQQLAVIGDETDFHNALKEYDFVKAAEAIKKIKQFDKAKAAEFEQQLTIKLDAIQFSQPEMSFYNSFRQALDNKNEKRALQIIQFFSNSLNKATNTEQKNEFKAKVGYLRFYLKQAQESWK